MEYDGTEIYKSIVYVLSREKYNQTTISKVGSTRISAHDRARNYTDGGWSVFFEMEVPGPLRFYIERLAHEILTEEGHWLDPNITGGTATEIFTCGPDEARVAVEKSYHKSMMQMVDYINNDPVFGVNSKLREMKMKIASLEKDVARFKDNSNELEFYRDQGLLDQLRAIKLKKIK